MLNIDDDIEMFNSILFVVKWLIFNCFYFTAGRFTLLYCL